MAAGFTDMKREAYLEEIHREYREEEYVKKTSSAIAAQVLNLESGKVWSAQVLGPDKDRIDLEMRGIHIIPSFQLDDEGGLRPKCREINQMLAAYLDSWELYWWWHSEQVCERGFSYIPVRRPLEGRLAAPATRWRRSAARVTISIRKRIFFSGGEI